MCLNYETGKMFPKGFEAKEEGEPTSNDKFSKDAPAASSSRQWSAAFRNPRIVRVSHSFGGKDRHSKVCTVRGLRDRRIRMSVPTAIQLYDLQERLGVNQPSKVIDWLLDATKQDIDKLPPLQMLPGFGQLHQQMLLSHHHGQAFNHTSSQPSLPPFFDADIEAEEGDQDHAAALRSRSKEVEKGKWVLKGTEQETVGDFYAGQNSSVGHRFFPLASANTGYTSMFPPNSMHMNSSYPHLEPSSTALSLSQFGSHGFLPHQANENYLSHLQAAAPSSINALPNSGPHQFLFCPPSSTPPLFPMFSSASQQLLLPNNSISNTTYNNQGPEQDRSS